VQELLQEVERISIPEDAARDPLTIRSPVDAENLLSKPRNERSSDAVIVREEVVDDLVARHRRGAVSAKALERRGLPGADPAGDGDREWARTGVRPRGV
jgi:hypothetical protein